ncbi:hypothetical protein LINPERPRIM_LOCUS2347 [Linum perenne]
MTSLIQTSFLFLFLFLFLTFQDIQPPAIFDGGCNDGSYLQVLNPGTGFDVDNQHSCLDVLPIVLKEVASPLKDNNTPFHASSHGVGVYSISMVEDGNKVPQCASQQLGCLSVVGLPAPTKTHHCSYDHLNLIDLQVETSDPYSPCIVDLDIKQPKSSDVAVGSIKTENVLTGMLQRQASLKTCGKLMEVFAKWRRCKRAASLDSRSIVLMFSILSSFGTLVLIYLTLRVRHAAADSFSSA